MLFAAGYLTAQGVTAGGEYQLVIPNKEVLKIYESKIKSWFKVKAVSDTDSWKEFCMAVAGGDAAAVQTVFNKFLSDSISIRDTFVKKEMKENFYHGMLLGLLKAEQSWIVKSNAESGFGYTDIMLIIPAEKKGCIIEVKYAEKGEYNSKCTEAMRQIENGRYEDILKQEGVEKIHKYGIACYKKACKVVHCQTG